MEILELILVNILVRFPLKIIARFRLVSKEWKSLIDSDFFRDHYISLNSSSSISWSIIQTKPHKLSLEIVGHHGCRRWGLSRSLGSLMSFFAETTIRQLLVLACTDGLVSIYAETSDGTQMYYIGNPLLQEWFRIPLPPFFLGRSSNFKNDNHFSDTGLVTNIENGIVVSYKIVWMFRLRFPSEGHIFFMIYSSETGLWKTKDVRCTRLCATFSSRHDNSIALNGILHWLSQDNEAFEATSIVAYDFYGCHYEDECRIVRFPSKGDHDRRFRRTFTTSQGSIVYFNEFGPYQNRTLRIWKLVKYTDGPKSWELSWELKLEPFLGYSINYFPVVMHPLNIEIIYLWSMYKNAVILFNLRTHVYSVHKETKEDGQCMDGCFLSFNCCKEYMGTVYQDYLRRARYRRRARYPRRDRSHNHLFFSQYVLPRWLHRLPRPQPN